MVTAGASYLSQNGRRLHFGLGNATVADKVIVAWNGLMIDAMARAGAALNESKYTAAAAKAADFIRRNLHREDGRLLHTWRHGTAKLDAYLAHRADRERALLAALERGLTSESDLLDAANRMAGFVLLAVVMRPAGGWLSDRIGPVRVLAAPVLLPFDADGEIDWRSLAAGVEPTGAAGARPAWLGGGRSGPHLRWAGKDVQHDFVGDDRGIDAHDRVPADRSGADDDFPGRLFTWWQPEPLADLLVGAGFTMSGADEGVRVASGNGPHPRVATAGTHPAVIQLDPAVRVKSLQPPAQVLDRCENRPVHLAPTQRPCRAGESTAGLDHPGPVDK